MYHNHVTRARNNVTPSPRVQARGHHDTGWSTTWTRRWNGYVLPGFPLKQRLLCNATAYRGYCLYVARLWRAESFCDGPSKIRVHVVSSVSIWVSMTSTTKHVTRTYLNKLVLLGPIVIKSWKSVCLSLSPGVYERLSTLFLLPVYYGRANEPCHQVIWNVNKLLVSADKQGIMNTYWLIVLKSDI